MADILMFEGIAVLYVCPLYVTSLYSNSLLYLTHNSVFSFKQ